ncbi:hypothetical protein LZ32DRAFT_103046 [Colletotrichum eremochloae]|nr:hypothetical protein LZ32DRAFT_103046 [Colletotrichum eremochloae]
MFRARTLRFYAWPWAAAPVHAFRPLCFSTIATARTADILGVASLPSRIIPKYCNPPKSTSSLLTLH